MKLDAATAQDRRYLLRKTHSNALLGLPENVAQIALLPVAYTIGTEFRPAHRPPPESITFFNGWRQTAGGGLGARSSGARGNSDG